MPRSDRQRTIDEARKSFDAILHTPEFNRVHGDDAQLDLLIGYLGAAPGGRYLDLGTGNGYVALAIAERHPGCRVTGVDVANRAIGRNVEIAREKGLSNVAFEATDGVRLDVTGASLDGVVCRYALHHLPDPRSTLGAVNAALKDTGRLVIADGVMDEADDCDFINRFQSLQPDGHVRIYPRDGLLGLLADCGFRPIEAAMTSIAYTRPLDPEYRALIGATPPPVLEAYGIAMKGGEVSARLDILNAALVKA